MDAKVSALSALTGANLAIDDLFYVVDTSATASKSIRADELLLSIKEADASPTAVLTRSLTFPNGTLTDNGSGSVTFVLPGSFNGFANPSANIGLTANNGSAVTAMRSDATPALDQAISPTWSGNHIFQTKTRIDSFWGTITADADGSTITFNLNTSNTHSVTLGGNRTLALSNETTGQSFMLILKQDGTGNRTVTWWSGILWQGGVVPTLTTTINKYDVFSFKIISPGVYLGTSALNF